jgi:two-component system, chemotaxis family, chemotaxis protein CheY
MPIYAYPNLAAIGAIEIARFSGRPRFSALIVPPSARYAGSPMPIDVPSPAERLAAAKIAVVDDEYFMRKVLRALLMSIGVFDIYEAPNGAEGLELIRYMAPNVVLLDWKMPGLDGPGFMRLVRSPKTFPYPNVPIIMLTGHGERSRVVEAVQLGVNEFLLKPVSTKALQDRLLTVLSKPRPLMKDGNYYGPTPRKMAAIHADGDAAIANLTFLN